MGVFRLDLYKYYSHTNEVKSLSTNCHKLLTYTPVTLFPLKIHREIEKI